MSCSRIGRPSSWGRLLPKFFYGHDQYYRKLEKQPTPHRDTVPADPVFIMSMIDVSSEEYDYYYIHERIRSKVWRNKQFCWHRIRTVDDSSIMIICSCDGLLVFRKSHRQYRQFSILNPVTWDMISIPRTTAPSYICGFFFHPLTGDYRVLCHLVSGEHAHCFMIFSLQTKSWRLVTTGFVHYDQLDHNPVNVDGTLYWMTCHKPVQLNQVGLDSGRKKIPCSQSILRFNTITEKFDAVPHPWHKYCSGLGVIQLMKMDEKLCLGHVQHRCIDLWILKGIYSESKWVKTYQVSLEWHPNPKFCPYGRSNDIRPVSIKNGELWIHWTENGLFKYNLESRILRKMLTLEKEKLLTLKKGKKSWQPLISYIPYTKTLVSLDSFR